MCGRLACLCVEEVARITLALRSNSLQDLPGIEMRDDSYLPEVRMPRDPRVMIFIGIKNAVVALDDRTGTELWRTQLHSADYVTVLWDGEALFAANGGEVWRLEPASGQVTWHNELKGLGRGLVSLASSRRPSGTADADIAAEKRRREAVAAAASAGD
jgi:hypothetical protein